MEICVGFEKWALQHISGIAFVESFEFFYNSSFSAKSWQNPASIDIQSCFSYFGFEIRWIHLISWIR